jgi:hypothetical protein
VTASTEPARVIVVEDPFNEYDAWSLAVSIIVASISVFLTWRALLIGQQANRAAAKAAEEAEHANREASKAREAVVNERRRMLELEMLRDLLRYFDVRIRRPGGAFNGPNGGRVLPDYEDHLSVAEILDRAEPWVLLIPPPKLKTWRRLAKAGENADEQFWRREVLIVAKNADIFSTEKNAFDTVKTLLRGEVLLAIAQTVEERDA